MSMGGTKLFGWGIATEIKEELQVVVDELAQRAQLSRNRDVRGNRAILRLDLLTDALDPQR